VVSAEASAGRRATRAAKTGSAMAYNSDRIVEVLHARIAMFPEHAEAGA